MAPLADDPPVPVDALFNPFTGRYVVTFDKPVQDAAVLTPGNWVARWTNTGRSCTAAEALGGQAFVGTAMEDPDVGPNMVRYSAVVPDLVGVNGLRVQPFEQAAHS